MSQVFRSLNNICRSNCLRKMTRFSHSSHEFHKLKQKHVWCTRFCNEHCIRELVQNCTQESESFCDEFCKNECYHVGNKEIFNPR